MSEDLTRACALAWCVGTVARALRAEVPVPPNGPRTVARVIALGAAEDYTRALDAGAAIVAALQLAALTPEERREAADNVRRTDWRTIPAESLDGEDLDGEDLDGADDPAPFDRPNTPAP